jgi:uncharacterized protein YukE
VSTDPAAGDPSGIRALAKAYTAASTAVSDGIASIKSAASEASTSWKGQAQTAFVVNAAAVPDEAARVSSRLDTAAAALLTYAAAVERIQDEARRITRAQATNASDIEKNSNDVQAATATVARADAVESDHVHLQRLQSTGEDLAALAGRLDAQWADLIADRQRADQLVVAALGSEGVLGALASDSRAALGKMSDAQLLSWLAALTPEEIAALAKDKNLGKRLAKLSDPEGVAAWWKSLNGPDSAHGNGSAAQNALIAAFPATIGNLEGVAYWARDQANRKSAAAAYAKAKTDVAYWKQMMNDLTGDGLGVEALQKYTEAQQTLAALKNLEAAGRSKVNVVGDVPRQLVSFDAGPPPLGAYSLGDLDKAANVTYLVPGMGTTLADTTVLMRAASNIMAEQQGMSSTSTAVVSWIGYKTPDNVLTTGSPAVFREGDADAGATRLTAALDGFHGTRPDATLNVVAHSYGSTTASLALHADPGLHVNSFVTLGSAGIPKQVPDAAATNAQHVYSAQADERWDVAALGRDLSVPHRDNPVDPSFHSTVINAGAVHGYAKVDVHDLMVNDGSTEGDHGYLDQDTNTLSATAKATLR